MLGGRPITVKSAAKSAFKAPSASFTISRIDRNGWPFGTRASRSTLKTALLSVRPIRALAIPPLKHLAKGNSPILISLR